MLAKYKLRFPKNLLLKWKKSIKNTMVFWIFSPFGLTKKILADLFFIKKKEILTLFFFFNKKKKDLILTQLTLLKNTFIGISRYYRLELWIKGVGFKFKLFKPNTNITYLKLSLGFSHILLIQLPKTVFLQLIGKKKLFFKGLSLQTLTQIISFIQKYKSPDPYKGKGLNFKYKVKLLKIGKKN